MILDSFFAFAAVIEAALLVVFVIVASNELRRKQQTIEVLIASVEGHREASNRWEEAYNAKAAQAEAYLGQLSTFPVPGSAADVPFQAKMTAALDRPGSVFGTSRPDSQDYQGPSYVDAALARNGSGS